MNNEGIFTLEVYPKGLERPPVILLFDSKESKQEYACKEFMYCVNAMRQYERELDMKKRKELKSAFYTKRAEFAKKSGFKQKRGTTKYWTTDPNEQVKTSKYDEPA
jgi:hypothetical protein